MGTFGPPEQPPSGYDRQLDPFLLPALESLESRVLLSSTDWGLDGYYDDWGADSGVVTSDWGYDDWGYDDDYYYDDSWDDWGYEDDYYYDDSWDDWGYDDDYYDDSWDDWGYDDGYSDDDWYYDDGGWDTGDDWYYDDGGWDTDDDWYYDDGGWDTDDDWYYDDGGWDTGDDWYYDDGGGDSGDDWYESDYDEWWDEWGSDGTWDEWDSGGWDGWDGYEDTGTFDGGYDDDWYEDNEWYDGWYDDGRWYADDGWSDDWYYDDWYYDDNDYDDGWYYDDWYYEGWDDYGEWYYEDGWYEEDLWVDDGYEDGWYYDDGWYFDDGWVEEEIWIYEDGGFWYEEIWYGYDAYEEIWYYEYDDVFFGERGPDLYMVPSVAGVPQGVYEPGDRIQVTWNTANDSLLAMGHYPPPVELYAPADGPWDEAVFLSRDGVLDNRDLLLGTVTYDDYLLPGEGHQITAPFALPDGLPPGEYKVIAYADYVPQSYRGHVREFNEVNNWAVTGIVRVGSRVRLGPAAPGVVLTGQTFVLPWEGAAETSTVDVWQLSTTGWVKEAADIPGSQKEFVWETTYADQGLHLFAMVISEAGSTSGTAMRDWVQVYTPPDSVLADGHAGPPIPGVLSDAGGVLAAAPAPATIEFVTPALRSRVDRGGEFQLNWALNVPDRQASLHLWAFHPEDGWIEIAAGVDPAGGRFVWDTASVSGGWYTFGAWFGQGDRWASALSSQWVEVL